MVALVATVLWGSRCHVHVSASTPSDRALVNDKLNQLGQEGYDNCLVAFSIDANLSREAVIETTLYQFVGGSRTRVQRMTLSRPSVSSRPDDPMVADYHIIIVLCQHDEDGKHLTVLKAFGGLRAGNEYFSAGSSPTIGPCVVIEMPVQREVPVDVYTYRLDCRTANAETATCSSSPHDLPATGTVVQLQWK